MHQVLWHSQPMQQLKLQNCQTTGETTAAHTVTTASAAGCWEKHHTGWCHPRELCSSRWCGSIKTHW